MRKKNFKGRCEKRVIDKCNEVCKTYDAIQYVYADVLQTSDEVKEIRCNVPLEGRDICEYTSDFVCVKAVADRPRTVTADLFVGKVINDTKGNEQVIDSETAQAIHYDMIVNGYIDRKGVLTDKYYADKANDELKVAAEVQDSAADVIAIVDSIYDSRSMQPENARSNMWNYSFIKKSWQCRNSRHCGNASIANLYTLWILIRMNWCVKQLLPLMVICVYPRYSSR